MKALVIEKGSNDFKYVEDRKKPSPGPDQILVHNRAVAINALDWKQAKYGIALFEFPAVVGIDGAGDIAEVGSNVKDFKVGDKVWGIHQVGPNDYATYNEYYLMDAKYTVPYVEGMSLEEAAANGVAVFTAANAVFYGLKVPILTGPESSKGGDEWVLLNGGAGSVGLWALQFLKLAGYKVVTTCSTTSNDVVKKYGATATVNYKDSEEDQLKAIKDITGGKLKMALDLVSIKTADQAKKALEQSSCSKKILGSLETEAQQYDASKSTDDLQITLPSMNYFGIGRDAELNKRVESYIPMITGLWKNKKVQSVPIRTFKGDQGGWKGVEKAIDENLKGNARAEKLVVIL